MTTEQKLTELSARVQVLEDEAAIRRLMADMMQKADDREFPQWGERMASFYTDDGQWMSGAGFADVGMAERGRAALVKKFTAGTRIAESSHLLGTESIEVHGDGANGTWLCFEPANVTADTGPDWYSGLPRQNSPSADSHSTQSSAGSATHHSRRRAVPHAPSR